MSEAVSKTQFQGLSPESLWSALCVPCERQSLRGRPLASALESYQYTQPGSAQQVSRPPTEQHSSTRGMYNTPPTSARASRATCSLPTDSSALRIRSAPALDRTISYADTQALSTSLCIKSLKPISLLLAHLTNVLVTHSLFSHKFK